MDSMEISNQINSELDKLLFIEKNDDFEIKLKPHVCCCCDKLIRYDQINYIQMKTLNENKDIFFRWRNDDDAILDNTKKSCYLTTLMMVLMHRIG